MKNKLTLLLIIFVITGEALPVMAGKRDFFVMNELNCAKEDNLQRCYNSKTGAPFNGELRLYYPDGKLRAQIEYADGWLDGKYLTYYNSGELKRNNVFRSGRQNGVQTTYFDNGNASGKTEYCDGVRCGFSRRFYRSGQIKTETFYKSGNRDGKYSHYYPNGSIAVRASFTQGKAVSGYCLMPDGQRKNLADKLENFTTTEETPCDKAIEYAEKHYSIEVKEYPARRGPISIDEIRKPR